MKWNDEYWPLLIQIYKKKPEGVKSIYSKSMVDIGLMLHIHPQELHKKMMELRKLDTPYIKQMWEELANNPRKLNKTVKILQEKEGFGTSGRYFEGIETIESWEQDFRPLEADSRITPMMLIIILDLYFQLTPSTMVKETEEIIETGKMLKLSAATIVDIMEVFQFCDPYLSRDDFMVHPLVFACQDIWNRFGNDDTEKLWSLAAQYKEYFK